MKQVLLFVLLIGAFIAAHVDSIEYIDEYDDDVFRDNQPLSSDTESDESFTDYSDTDESDSDFDEEYLRFRPSKTADSRTKYWPRYSRTSSNLGKVEERKLERPSLAVNKRVPQIIHEDPVEPDVTHEDPNDPTHVNPDGGNNDGQQNNGGDDQQNNGGDDQQNNGGNDQQNDGGDDQQNNGGDDQQNNGGDDQQNNGGNDQQNNGGNDQQNNGHCDHFGDVAFYRKSCEDMTGGHMIASSDCVDPKQIFLDGYTVNHAQISLSPIVVPCDPQQCAAPCNLDECTCFNDYWRLKAALTSDVSVSVTENLPEYFRTHHFMVQVLMCEAEQEFSFLAYRTCPGTPQVEVPEIPESTVTK